MILLSLIFSASVYQAMQAQPERETKFPMMIPHCDTTRKLGDPDYGNEVLDPTLPSDTLTQVPPLKTKSKYFAASEDQVYEFYIGKRGKEIKHGLFRRVSTDMPKGEVIEEGYYSHNLRIGRWVTRYSSGVVQSETEYRDGKRNGKQIGYHQNGVVSGVEEFVDGLPDCKDAYTIGFHENGKLKYEFRIRDGYLVQESRYDTSGVPVVKEMSVK